MTKKSLVRRICTNASIIEAVLDRKIAKYEDKSGKVVPHIYIEPLPEHDYECLPPKETHKIKVRIAKITNGKPRT